MAKWIWSDDSDGRGYNLCSVFKRELKLDAAPARAELQITADSWYRLKINGSWIGDGPARSYPEHISFDRYDLFGILRGGSNMIEVTVRYYGLGDFHRLPQRGGLWAELEAVAPDGEKTLIGTDDQWVASPLPQWVCAVPPLSAQRCPQELYDASNPERCAFRPATVICDKEEGPWKGFQERESQYLTRKETLLTNFLGAARVEKEHTIWAFSPHLLHFPGDTNLNSASSNPVFLALKINSPKMQEIPLFSHGLNLSVNGSPADENGNFLFLEGENTLVAVSENWMDGHAACVLIAAAARFGLSGGTSEKSLSGTVPELTKLRPGSPHTWGCADLQQQKLRFEAIQHQVLTVRDFAGFRQLFPEARPLREEEFLDNRSAISFRLREALPAEAGDVVEPEALIYPDCRCTVVNPVEGKDVELAYDFGEETIGYWNFVVFAPAGTVLDFNAVEYVTQEGVIQHTSRPCYCNNLRYVCREGVNRFTSMIRRGGRYLFVTVRRMTGPVKIQSIRLAESTYPVAGGSFRCSDFKLNRLWEISLRTLKLCMEDTFTDCPLYEQTLWIGDARSEGLFAMSSIGAYDLVRRCIRIGAQSLDRTQLVGCLAPSTCELIIPIWSFMWGMSVEDYWKETGDLEFVREIWPAVKKNLAGAKARISPENGLMSSFDWNLFDWSGSDGEHQFWISNTIFLVGALRSAGNLAEVLGDTDAREEYAALCQQLTEALNRVWNVRELAFPEYLKEDGSAGEQFSMHTSVLALLYDAASAEHLASARANMLTPRRELIKFGSPFALFYLYMAMEKIGFEEQILPRLLEDYQPMLESGATTAWESFPSGSIKVGTFPTRSHCHAWSSTPLYYLPKLVLGVVPEGDGKHFKLSPWIDTLDWAEGSRSTVHGPIRVAWRKTGGKKLEITLQLPPEVEVEFVPNRSTRNWEICCRRENPVLR